MDRQEECILKSAADCPESLQELKADTERRKIKSEQYCDEGKF